MSQLSKSFSDAYVGLLHALSDESELSQVIESFESLEQEISSQCVLDRVTAHHAWAVSHNVIEIVGAVQNLRSRLDIDARRLEGQLEGLSLAPRLSKVTSIYLRSAKA
jgi:hypothetical protein